MRDHNSNRNVVLSFIRKSILFGVYLHSQFNLVSGYFEGVSAFTKIYHAESILIVIGLKLLV